MRAGRSAVVCLTALILAGFALLPQLGAQVINLELPGQANDLEGQRGASTRELVKRLARGRRLLIEKSYAEGARLLQAIIESDEDAFFFPDPENKSVEQSLKAEAQKLLGEMPAEGLAIYQKQYGPAARRLFEDALKSHDANSLAQVARHYLHTQAGCDAAYRVATDHLDHERSLTAALSFERLRNARHFADRLEPFLSLKTALSWMRAGSNDKAVQVLVEMQARHHRTTLTWGGREVALFAEPAGALAWLTTLAGEPPIQAAASADQWTIAGGDSRRNALSAGGSPYLNRGWRFSTVEGATTSPENDAIVARAFRERRPAVPGSSEDSNGPLPTVPVLQPLVVDGLVIIRTIGDVRAYDLITGRLAWTTGEKDQLLIELLRAPATPQAQPPGGGPIDTLVASRGWEDTTFGTLSSDSAFVFAIEDLGLGVAGMTALPRLVPFREHNRLVAYDVKTGRAMWEVGGPRSDVDDELLGAYFLGAPLVLDHRLYCLVESGSEVRLLVLDPQTGGLEWSQTISSVTPTGFDMYRQKSGLSPSFFGEILVCPIGSDQIVAVDLTQRSLAWRHSFHSQAELYDPRRVLWQQRQAQQQGTWSVDQNHWLDSLAIIGEMRAIVTPRDANELYCLNLLDGSLLWKKPRGEGLFVAGIQHGKVIVVGHRYVQAVNLSDGEPAWPEPATLPVPSGRGFIAGDHLYLPLITAEVATIDLRVGRVVARARSLSGNVPGNLVSVRGAVISQGADFIEAFRQLDALESEIGESLAKNPADAQALALRGEIQLQRGKVAEAYSDLKRALVLKSDDAAVRALLVGSLLEGLRVDFDAYRGLEADAEQLLTNPDERSTYLWLTAQGLKRAGEPRAALAALLRFADSDVSDRELERIDGALVVRRDRLVRARSVELYATASSAMRAELDREYRARTGALGEKRDRAAIRRFLRYFRGLSDSAEIERLSVELPPDDNDWLEEEFRLEPLSESSDPQTAAAATARMAQLLLAAERPRDALVFIRRLEQASPAVVCLDGKTGLALASTWRKRSEIERELTLDAPWPLGRVEAEYLKSVPGTAAAQRSFEITIAGQRQPHFNDTILHVSGNWKDFFARDGFGRELWKVSLDNPVPQPILVPQMRAFVCGHFVLISIGTQVLAIDTLGTPDQPGARLLWKLALTSSGRSGNIVPRFRPGNQRRQIMFNNQLGDQVGTIGPVTFDHVTLLTGHKLMALDPLSGKPLWMREGVASGVELFGDEELLYAVPAEGNQAVVYSALDGTILGNRALPPVRHRIDTVGRNIVTARIENSRQVLALYDPWSGKELWSKPFADTAQIALVELDEAAILEPSGKLTILSLADGSVRFESATEPEPQLRQIHVIRASEQYVLIANQVTVIPGWQPVTPQAIPIRGRIYGFDRQTGKRLWTREIDRHGVELHQPSHLPVLTLICNFNVPKANGPGLESHCGLTCIDKRTGEIVFDNRHLDEQIFFVEYTVDSDLKQLELRLFRSILRLTFTDNPLPDR